MRLGKARCFVFYLAVVVMRPMLTVLSMHLQNPEEAAAIVTSAYILNDARTFEAITSRVIKRFTITMEGLRMREQPETLPTRMLCTLCIHIYSTYEADSIGSIS